MEMFTDNSSEDGESVDISIESDCDEFVFTQIEPEDTSKPQETDDSELLCWGKDTDYDDTSKAKRPNTCIDDSDISLICSTFRSYRRIRKYEVNLHDFNLGKEELNVSGESNAVAFNDPETTEFSKDDAPIDLGSNSQSSPSESSPPILRDNTKGCKMSRKSPKEFFTLIGALMEDLNADSKIPPSEVKSLYHIGAHYVGAVAEDVLSLLTLAFTTCKQFTTELRRLAALATRAILLLNNEEQSVEEYGLQAFHEQVRQSYMGCEKLLRDIQLLKADVDVKRTFWHNNTSETIDLVHEVCQVDTLVERIYQHYLSGVDELDFKEPWLQFPQYRSYNNAIKFLLSEEPHCMMDGLELDMAQVLVDLRELEESVKVLMEGHEGKLY